MNLCKTCGTICPFDDEHEECEHYKPMTNEDWLRSCTTEELAECLTDISFSTGDDLYDFVRRKIMEWLKQPHHD